MTTFWEFYNWKYVNDYELEKSDCSSFENDCEILVEIDGEYHECNIGSLKAHDGKLVLEIGDEING